MDDYYTVSEAARILSLGGHRIRQMLREGELEGRRDQMSGRWFADKRAVHALKEERDAKREARAPARRPSETPQTPVEALQYQERLEALARELGRLEGRLQLTEQAESTLREQLERERERAVRAEAELQAERSKGFWARMFGG
jgi:hypothetical protein